METLIDKVIEDFKKEANITDSSENFIALMHLKDSLLEAMREPTVSGECECICDYCQDCEYN